jgi:hypothetical protein
MARIDAARVLVRRRIRLRRDFSLGENPLRHESALELADVDVAQLDAAPDGLCRRDDSPFYQNLPI